MKTPTEEIWKGVSSLPDYHATFPNWTNFTLPKQVPNLRDDGLDLLTKMLIYDPAKRISAKQTALHPYFKDLDCTVKPVIVEKEKS